MTFLKSEIEQLIILFYQSLPAKTITSTNSILLNKEESDFVENK